MKCEIEKIFSNVKYLDSSDQNGNILIGQDALLNVKTILQEHSLCPFSFIAYSLFHSCLRLNESSSREKYLSPSQIAKHSYHSLKDVPSLIIRNGSADAVRSAEDGLCCSSELGNSHLYFAPISLSRFYSPFGSNTMKKYRCLILRITYSDSIWRLNSESTLKT